MANYAEFEEKEFEGSANAELANGGPVWPSGQVIEEIVGYDAIAAPVARHVIWQLLRVPRPPGVRLLPCLWAAGQRPPANRLPQTPVSLILQYKRPEYMRGPQAAQWRYWHQPYFRFNRSESQHRVLRRLDRLLDGQAIIRYASPAFWKFAELEAAVVTREVLSRTGFIRPTALAAHKVWTYVQPGIDGRANPSGQRLPFETISQVIGDLRRPDEHNLPVLANTAPERLGQHLRSVAEVARSREPSLRRRVTDWVDAVRRRDLLLSDAGLQQLADVATISSLAHSIGSSWQIIDASEPAFG